MADATSTNDTAPIAIVIETKDATITVVPTGRVQERLHDIAAAGIDMQLVTDWIAAGYSNSSQPVHHLIASDVSDLWHIRTDTDIVRLLQSETAQRRIVPKNHLSTRLSPLFAEGYPPSKVSDDRLGMLHESALEYTPFELRDIERYDGSSLPLNMERRGYEERVILPSIPERHHWHENLGIPELTESYQRLVNVVSDTIFRNRTPEEFVSEILAGIKAQDDAMTEQADRIVRDGEERGDAMLQRAKELAEDAFKVIPKLPIDEHLEVPMSDVSVHTGGNEPPRVIGKETEAEIPSVRE